MKCLPQICVIAIIISQVAHIHGNLEEAQEICPILATIKEPMKWSDLNTTALVRSWTGKNDFLWKVTEMPNYYHYFDENENFCDATLYGPDCKSSQYFSISRPEITSEAANFTYNSKTKNTIRIQYKVERVREDYIIMRNEIKAIELIDTKSGHATGERVHKIPKFVRTTFEIPYAILSIHALGHWTIFQSCDGKVTSVRLSTPFLSYNPDSKVLAELLNLNIREKTLDDKLDELGIDKSTLITVPLSPPFYPGSV